MKALVFLHPHFLKNGGASKVVLEQASLLTKLGVNCIIVTTRVDPKVIRPYSGLKIIEIGGLPTGSLIFWITFPLFYYKLHKIINNIPNNILFCHSLAIYWGAIYKIFNPHSLVTCYFHDLGFPYTDSDIEINGLSNFYRFVAYIMRPVFSVFNKIIISSTDYLIANSRTTSDFLYSKYKRRSDLVITPGFDPKIYKPLRDKNDYIITVGRLVKTKNIDVIIRGFSLFVRNNPDIKIELKIIGDGIERKTLERLVISLKMNNLITFLGQLNSKQVAIVLAKAKAGIFMCTNEPFGLAALETLACGTDIIGPKSGGIQEICKSVHSGILVEPKDTAIAKGLKYLLFNPKKANPDLELYTWDRQIGKLYKFLSQIN